MAIGTLEDFKIYQDYFTTGMLESLEQDVSVLNATGSIAVVTANTRGEYTKQSFFANIDDLITDRDVTSVDPVTSKKLSEKEIKNVLHNYKLGPVRQSIDSFRKNGQSPQVFSFVVGQAAGQHMAERYLNIGLSALVAAMSSEAGMVFDNTVAGNAAKTGGTTISARALNRAKGLLGDKQARARLIVGPSAVWNELIDNQIVEKLGEVSGQAIYGSSPGTMGLPMYVTDSPALTFEVNTGTDLAPVMETRHNVLILTDAALVLDAQDYMDIASQVEMGLENLVNVWQAESAFLVKVKGFSYTGTDTDSASLGTQANWSYIYESVKTGPGVLLVVADSE